MPSACGLMGQLLLTSVHFTRSPQVFQGLLCGSLHCLSELASHQSRVLEKPRLRASSDVSIPRCWPSARGWDVRVSWFPWGLLMHSVWVFSGVLHHHGEMGHQHEGGSELAEPGAERVHPHPLRRHHWGLHKGTGGGVPGVCTKVREAVSLVSLERWRLGAGWVPVLGLPGCRLLRKLRQPWCWCHLVVNQTLLQHSWLMQSVTQGAPGWDLVRRCVLPLPRNLFGLSDDFQR